jgi:uncharacterized membrane protein
MLRKEMKDAAKASIRGAQPHPAVVTLVFLLMPTGLSFAVQGILTAAYGMDNILYWTSRGHAFYQVFSYYAGRGGVMILVFINLLIGLYSMVVNFGYMGSMLRVSRGEPIRFGSLLDGFALAGRVIALNLLMGIFIFLWSLLFVIPGIIAAYRYRMAVFILLHDPDCGALEAIGRSKEMMAGHKMDLFVLDISYINWALAFIPIGIISTALRQFSMILSMSAYTVLAGALSLWVLPFFICTQANFYGGITGSFRSGGSRFYGPDVRF